MEVPVVITFDGVPVRDAAHLQEILSKYGPKPQWTTDKPTEPGWYPVRVWACAQSTARGEFEVVRIDRKGCIYRAGMRDPVPCESFIQYGGRIHFADAPVMHERDMPPKPSGPLPPPEPPEE